MGGSAPARVGLSFVIDEPPEQWRLEEEDVPESPLHEAIIELLVLVLKRWAESEGRSALVCSNLACRWDPDRPRVGTDPDVVLVDPAPPGGEDISSLRVWERGHAPPRVAVEVVSATNPQEDYVEAPLRCARLGARELWIFDPKRLGPAGAGGPFTLQVWGRRDDVEHDEMQLLHAGEGPAFSPELVAWLVVTDGGRRLRVAHDAEGHRLWPTPAEAEQAENERLAEEAERLADETERLAEENARLLAKLRALGVDLDSG
jgi:Uma2 family endonuclease